MSYKVFTIQCPNCQSNCKGVYELFHNGIKKLVGVNCYICGLKKKIVAGENKKEASLPLKNLWD